MYAALLFKMMDRKEEQLKWLYNVKAVSVIFFDEDTMRSDSDSVYYIWGDNGYEKFTHEMCLKVFPNQSEENIVYLKDCGHYVMDEKPEETTHHMLKFMEEIDKKFKVQHFL